MRLKIKCLVILFIISGLCFSNITYYMISTVYASKSSDDEDDEDDLEDDEEDEDEDETSRSSSSSSTGTLTTEEVETVKSELGIDAKKFENLVTAYSILAASYGDVIASAICGNINQESHFALDLVELDPPNGVGLIQWSFGRRLYFSEYCRSNDTSPVYTLKAAIKAGSSTDSIITDASYVTVFGRMEYQLTYLLGELNGGLNIELSDSSITSTTYAGKSVTTTADWSSSGVPSKYGFSQYANLDSISAFFACKDVEVATVNFCSHFERPQFDERSGMNNRIKYANAIYDNLAGKGLGGYLNSGTAGATATQAVLLGYWDERQLASFSKLTEIDINSILDNARRERLNQSELYSLKQWEDNVGRGREVNIFITCGRRAVAFLSILFMVWMLFIYVAYWFDRVNNFFDINMLGMVTFGRLRIAPLEEDSTYSKKSESEASMKTVGHRDVLFIIITGLVFGAVIATGQIYVWIAKIVTFMMR